MCGRAAAAAASVVYAGHWLINDMVNGNLNDYCEIDAV